MLRANRRIVLLVAVAVFFDCSTSSEEADASNRPRTMDETGVSYLPMDLATLQYEREVLSLALKRWDDLLPPKEREHHPARTRLAEQIAAYDEQIRGYAGQPDALQRQAA